jgi:hypothetical protein
MALIETDNSNPSRQLTADDYSSTGELETLGADLALVVGSASKAEAYVSSKQWNLLWRDSDMLYQSPRPMSVYENTYVLEPNVQRFTVAKTVNAIVPSLYKGLFYADPPMILRPRPGITQDLVSAKTAMASYLLDACKFKTETKWGLEQMGNLGTSIWKWGIEYKEVISYKRKARTTTIPFGPTGSTSVKTDKTVVLEGAPDIEETKKIVPRPFFECKAIERVLVDPHLRYGDIRLADFVVDVVYMDFYQLRDLKAAIDSLEDDDLEKNEWYFPKTENELMQWWLPPAEPGTMPSLTTDQAALAQGIVHHAEKEGISVSPDLLRNKLEILEYVDKGRKITVVDRKKVIQTGKNKFNCINYLSANWWNRPKAFFGMGLGLIVGQNQRVDQGTINSILKILSFGVNPIYLRQRDSNNPTQMIRTGLGKILSVDGDVEKAYKLMETPKVPGDVWNALRESEQATESSSGADQQLVQGSTAGPRSSMGRTASGAGIQANASATRLDGPLDNFIDQVFKPFLYILDMLVLRFMPDTEIEAILGEELGKQFTVNLQDYHEAVMEYETLAGASLAAKRTMAQSLTLITQIFNNPQLQESLAEINGEYIDFKPILKMWMESSEWKDVQDIIKPLTPEMKQRMAQKNQTAQQNSKLQGQMALNNQKAQLKAQENEQTTDLRMKRDFVLEAARANTESEAVSGEPGALGVEGQEPQVE